MHLCAEFKGYTEVLILGQTRDGMPRPTLLLQLHVNMFSRNHQEHQCQNLKQKQIPTSHALLNDKSWEEDSTNMANHSLVIKAKCCWTLEQGS